MRRTACLPLLVATLSILALSAAPASAARCGPCEVVQERCSANCFGLDRAEIGGCLMACDNEAATCSCDEAVTLSSEDFVARFGFPEATKLSSPFVTELAAACHSTTPCGTAFPSCASWSGYSDCDDAFCGSVRGCGECEEEFPRFCPGPGMKQWRERFRVCFNALGQSCTEYQRTLISLGCGC
jgi:hypothetical protein